MIQSLLTKETPEIIRFFRNIGSLSEMLDKQEEKLRPVLNGERYITDCELAEQLKLTRRTLAEYRINGKLPYYKIGGKLLYKEKDILALLERNRVARHFHMTIFSMVVLHAINTAMTAQFLFTPLKRLTKTLHVIRV